MNDLIHLQSDTLEYTGVRLANPHRITVPDGITAVVGPNGAGKSTLGNILEKGWNFRSNSIASANGKRLSVKKIEFSDIHSLAGASVEYYQQRYEATANDEVPTVAEALDICRNPEKWLRYSRLFGLEGKENSRINWLSSGELRKMLITNAILDSDVDLLILDNPYIGLDRRSRAALDKAIGSLAADGIGVLLLVASPDDVPDHTACIIPMRDLNIFMPITEIPSISRMRNSLAGFFDFAVNLDEIPPRAVDSEPITTAVKLDSVAVRHGSLTILENLSWEIADGQCWALSGPNGSGKSTLLSLICGDNPQAYSNRITLFDRQRGSGESIWEIKRRIGFLSPELTLHFHPGDADVETIVAQGLNDASGAFLKPRPLQLNLARRWLSMLHIKHLGRRRLPTLSAGERQMVMIARTLIRQPRLLILDEPFHALDSARSRAVRAIINHFAARAAAEPAKYPMSLIFVSHNPAEVPECVNFTKTL